MTDHLILSALPTPNGELHLGHLGGPFLAADALARHLRAEGHRVTVFSATDGWESYVLDAARREDRTPEETAHDYHVRIRAALAATDCAPDVFLDLHDEPAAHHHRAWHHWLAERLDERRRVEVRGERLLADAADGEELVACWLAGRCPACGEGVSGYTCEACGMWFQPGLVRDARSRHPRTGVTGTRTRSAFLRLDTAALIAMAHQRQVPEGYVDLVHRYLELNGPVWRLTHPLGWGIPWTTGGTLAARQVHSTYALGTTAMFLLAGQQHARLHGLPRNPFLPDGGSRPRFTLCFGMDGALPLLMQLAVQEAAEVPSAPDEYRFNQFMTLDGEKFSTSRHHVIRVSDYVTAGLDTDALRFHLARRHPGEKPTDFTPEAFAEDVAETLVGRLGRVLDLCEGLPSTAACPPTAASPPPAPAASPFPAASASLSAAPSSARVLGLYEATADRHRKAFVTGDLAEAAAAVDDWLAVAPAAVEASGATATLAVLAALSAPLMPRWAEEVWSRLSLPGTPAPTVARELLAADAGRRPVSGRLPRFAPVSAAAVRALAPKPR
ncbi:class I tRNA ligase family protein [Streptomyces sp. NBC_00250]|uniref:class I tRNA ligase family protein n=1 Tax=Streptomyces sp. NBC_00250 TaxID=2903641 RepID=UPI002E285730|nr:class I tRNA ligase family protein [Streptomyces sp. NBC_00250]